jgi:hypothetical protein
LIRQAVTNAQAQTKDRNDPEMLIMALPPEVCERSMIFLRAWAVSYFDPPRINPDTDARRGGEGGV